MDWRPVQGEPRLSPDDRWDRLCWLRQVNYMLLVSKYFNDQFNYSTLLQVKGNTCTIFLHRRSHYSPKQPHVTV